MRQTLMIVVFAVVVALTGSACSSADDTPTAIGTATASGTATGSTTATAAIPSDPVATGDSAVSEPTEASSTDVPAPPETTDTVGTSSPTRDDANVDARDFEVAPDTFAFVSPSRNIYCAIRTAVDDPLGLVGCQAVTSVPASNGTVCDNSGSNAYAVHIDGSEVTQFCTNQGIYIPSSNPRTLEYGQILMVRNIPCASTVTGISCWAAGDNGFTISRDTNTTIGG